ncbi:MAG: trypsin-like serine protease [Pirellulales bacterium]|nr:trypsin-like serine protease [Pirellulales bacterium]
MHYAQQGQRGTSGSSLLPISLVSLFFAAAIPFVFLSPTQAIGILEGGEGVGLGGNVNFGDGPEHVLPAGTTVPESVDGGRSAYVDFGEGPELAIPTILAGELTGTPSDSPANRVDPNTLTSPYGGVGSLRIISGKTFICSGVAISPWNVLTAAHCLDLDNNGVVDVSPGNVLFRLNHGSNFSSSHTASALAIHPDFSGFSNPVVNDDIAVVTLSTPLPAGTPIYDLHATPITAGTTLTLVGYGESGTPSSGYSVNTSFSTKRVGKNNADNFTSDFLDEGGLHNEVFRYDFDGPTGNGIYGGPTLGNDIETIIGGGDSGGPAFVDNGGDLEIAGVNTFTLGNNPAFGARAGGILIAPYASWVNAQIIPEPSSMILAGLGIMGLIAPRRLRKTL